MATSMGPSRKSYPPIQNGSMGSEYLFFLLLFPVTSTLIGFNLYHPSLVILSLFVVYQLFSSSTRKLSASFAIVMVLWAVFLLYAAISMFWSPSSNYAMSKFFRLATICSLLLIVPTVLFPDTKNIYNFFKFSIYASVAVSVAIILGYLSPAYPRPYELLGSLSHLAPGRIMGFGIIVTTYYVLSSRRKSRRVTYGFMLGFLLLGILVSGSRGPLIAAMGSTVTLIFLVLYVKRRQKRRAFLFLLASFTAIVSLFVLHLAFNVTIPNFDRIIPLLQGEFDPSNERRLRFYREGVLLWLESPLIGSGFGSYGVWIHGADVEEYPHNFVLEILSELGVVGLLIFGAFLGATLLSIVANHRKRPVSLLLLCLFIYALINASFSQDLQGDRMIYAVIGLSTYVGLSTEYDLRGILKEEDRDTSAPEVTVSTDRGD